MNSTTPLLYPQVPALPSQQPGVSSGRADRAAPGTAEEFGRAFDKALQQVGQPLSHQDALQQAQQPLKFSAHASQRISSRNIAMDQQLMNKLHEAILKAGSKGIEDSLVLTKDAAFIVNVPNKTVVTALDRDQLNGNVFTQIDGAIVI